MIYIITGANIREYEDIPTSVKPERLQVVIKKAQDLDLKPFLGAAFFYELIKQFNEDGTIKDDAAQKYKDLVNGCEYTDQAGHEIVYEGLKKPLVYFAFARFIESDAYRYTATGPVIKNNDYSEGISDKGITKLVQAQRSTANAYTNDVEKFLNDRKSDFALWNFSAKNKSARQSGPRIRSVDKTRYNGFGNYNNNGLTDIING